MFHKNRGFEVLAVCGAIFSASTLCAQNSNIDELVRRMKVKEGARPTQQTPTAKPTPARPASTRPQPAAAQPQQPKNDIEEVKRIRPDMKKLSDIETRLSEKSQERYDEIQMIIYNAVYDDRADIEKLSVLKDLYAQIEKKFPLTPTQPLVEKSLEELSEAAKQKTKEKYPTTVKTVSDQAAQEAAAKYPMDAIRSKVTLNYRRGPQTLSITGVLYKITDKNILVGDSTITLIDMDDETRSRFDKELNEKLRSKYVNAKTDEYKKLRSDYAMKIREELKAKQHLENEKNGYIYIEGDMRWTTAKSLIQPIIDAEQKKLGKYKEYMAKVEEAEKAELARIAAENAAAAAAAGEGGAAIKVNVSDEHYQKITAEAVKKLDKVNSMFSGIDADQGYKNVLWGTSRIETHTLLSREPEFKYMRGQIGSDIITMPEGEKPEIVELFFKDGVLYKTIIAIGKLNQSEFDAFKNSIHGKNGRSDEENADPTLLLFKQLTLGEYKQEKPETEANEEETPKEELTKEMTQAEMIAAKLSGRHGAISDEVKTANYEDYTFHWTGKAAKGTLTFSFDIENKVYANVTFIKEFDFTKAAAVQKAAEAAK